MKLLLLALLVTQTPFGGPRPVTSRHVPRQEATPQALRLVNYDVQDLVQRDVVDFEPIQLGVDQPKRAPANTATTPPDALARRVAACHALTDAIRKHMAPKLEEPRDHLSCHDSGSFIQANLNAEQHAWLTRFLNVQRKFEALISLEARVFQLESGELKKLGIDSSAVLPKAEDRDALLAKLAAARSRTSTTSPRVLAFPNQRSHISVIKQVAYIKSFTTEVVEPGQREIADPEIAVIHEGLMLGVRATPLDEGILALDLALDCAEVVRPIKTRKVRLSTSAPSEGEIGVPEVLSSRIVATMAVREGSSVVLSTPLQGDRKGELVLVLTAERVPNPVSTPEAK